MSGVIETLEKARSLAARIKKAKNDLAWMTHNTDALDIILKQKVKLHLELSKEIPELTAKIADRREHLAKLDKFVDKHANSIENADEIERVAAKMTKLMSEVSALRQRMEEKANGSSRTTP